MSTTHEALLLLRSMPAHLGIRLRGFERQCLAALVELARACPAGSDTLLALLLLVFGDVPATLSQEELRRTVTALPFPAVLQLASSNELHVTSENDVLVGHWGGGRRRLRRGAGLGSGVGWG